MPMREILVVGRYTCPENSCRCAHREQAGAASVNIDDIVRVQHVAQTGETITSRHHIVRAGGKGANQAVAAALVRSSGHLHAR